MSIEALSWAMAQEPTFPEDKLVLIGLAEFCDRDGLAEAPSERLWRFACMSVDSLGTSLHRLDEDGLIAWSGLDASLKYPRQAATAVMSAKRRFVYERDDWVCVYCGSGSDLSLDHVQPRSRGGGDDVSNLSTACKSCNSSKGARTPAEWRAACS